MLGLEPAQRAAIVQVEAVAGGDFFCTGVLVDARWVLTAAHCVETPVVVRFGGGSQAPSLPQATVVVHPEFDLALVQLDGAPAGGGQPDPSGAEPIGTLETPIGDSWREMPIQLAGYGLTHEGDTRQLRFLVELVTEIDETFITVAGQGPTGACAGDSGGPLLGRDDDGRVAVVGVLSVGSASCMGIDRYTRADRIGPWIAAQLGDGASPAPAGCGAIDTAGRCRRGRALFCDEGRLRSVLCEAPAVCGWDPAADGYRCVAADEPCEGAGDLGVCDGDQARVCDGGALRVTDCGATCGAGCTRSPRSGVATCAAQ